ncbi:zinc finger CCCH domain-containing protein 15-like [Silene latifolia]|uniref:zinc finger CCCH domain-containing protein 15-like n=1 Tax=Silene latifolia TaxID=37657 RepID=UPI003D76E1C7
MQQEISSSVMSNLPRMSQLTGGVSEILTSKPYSSVFFDSDHYGVSLTPVTANSSDQSATATAAAVAAAFSRLLSQHNDLLNRYAFYMSKLQEAFKEAEILRQENTNLRFANRELSQQISVLLEAATFQEAATFSEPLASASCFSSGEKKTTEENEGGVWEERVENTSEGPTSVIEKENKKQQKVEEGRVSPPKSISVRSNDYLKMSPGGASCATGSSSEPKLKLKHGGSPKTRALSPVSGAQKVYVRGGSKKDGPIVLDVFNQGMFKTELCNKWQDTGDCPYGDHCQFAHGIKELRPVIRHPRYKTEVCRMILSGDSCPYGHRCHFRHALTLEEQLIYGLG